MDVVWPDPTHAKPIEGMVGEGLLPWVGAIEILNLEEVGKSLFAPGRKNVAATKRRIAMGVVRYGLEQFIVPKDRGRLRHPHDAYIRGIRPLRKTSLPLNPFLT